MCVLMSNFAILAIVRINFIIPAMFSSSPPHHESSHNARATRDKQELDFGGRLIDLYSSTRLASWTLG